MLRHSIALRSIRSITSVLFFSVAAIGASNLPAVRAATGPVIVPATLGGEFKTPLDSTPSPDGRTIYFTASDKTGKANGVFKVAASGGQAQALFLGAPFVAPTGIAASLDGQHVFVADPKAGQLFTLSTSGDAKPAPIPGTQGTGPRNLDVVSERDQVTIYYTGKDPQDGQPTLFKISMFGAAKPVTVFKGTPLVEPDGVAIGPDGAVYVADRAAAGAGSGKVFKIANGVISELVAKVRTGNPGGIALTKDGGTLLVSSFQANSKFDQVLVVNTATGAAAVVTDVVGKNSAAGGLHRAHDTNVFSWIDRGAPCNSRGCVYRVEP